MTNLIEQGKGEEYIKALDALGYDTEDELFQQVLFMTLNDKEQILKLQHHFTLNNDKLDKKYMQNIIVLDPETSTCYA